MVISSLLVLSVLCEVRDVLPTLQILDILSLVAPQTQYSLIINGLFLGVLKLLPGLHRPGEWTSSMQVDNAYNAWLGVNNVAI